MSFHQLTKGLNCTGLTQSLAVSAKADHWDGQACPTSPVNKKVSYVVEVGEFCISVFAKLDLSRVMIST